MLGFSGGPLRISWKCLSVVLPGEGMVVICASYGVSLGAIKSVTVRAALL